MIKAYLMGEFSNLEAEIVQLDLENKKSSDELEVLKNSLIAIADKRKDGTNCDLEAHFIISRGLLLAMELDGRVALTDVKLRQLTMLIELLAMAESLEQEQDARLKEETTKS